MENQSYNFKMTNDRKIIADFLGSSCILSNDAKQQYRKLFSDDYPYPIKFSLYKLLTVIFIFVFLSAMFFSPLFKEWISLLINLFLVLICFVSFNFVRKIRYPNEQFSILFILFGDAIAIGLLTLSFFNKESLMSNLFYLKAPNYIGIDSPALIGEVEKAGFVFTIVSCCLSLCVLVYGNLMGKKRLGSVMCPLIVVGGILMFYFIANLAYSKNVLNSLTKESGEVKTFVFYLILVASILAMLAYDFVLIHLSILFGGKPSTKR